MADSTGQSSEKVVDPLDCGGPGVIGAKPLASMEMPIAPKCPYRLKRMVHKVVDANTEYKSFVYPDTQPIDWAGFAASMTAISQGSTGSTRKADVIELHTATIKWRAEYNPASGDKAQLRLLIFQWKNTGDTPTAAKILELTDAAGAAVPNGMEWQAALNEKNKPNMHILYDYAGPLVKGSESQQITDQKQWSSFPIDELIYQSGSNLSNGDIWILALSSISSGASTSDKVGLEWTWDLYFYD
jgi:hypothetical protein